MLRQIRYESAQRYYLVRCARNLFGELVLSRYWGGLGSRRGGERHAVMADADALAEALAAIARRPQRHAYRGVSRQ